MRHEPALVIALAVGAGLVVVLASNAARPPSAPPPVAAGVPGPGGRAPDLPAPVTVVAAAPQPALAALGDGYAAYGDGEGRIFLLKREGDSFVLRGAYALRSAPRRDLLDPAMRSPSGFYLDDLGRERERALAAARAALERELAKRAVDVKAHARAEARARDVIAAGDATYLVEKLKDPRYTARRAAAFVLAEEAGEAGRTAAKGVLEEVVREEAGTPAEARARALLAP